MALGPIQGKQNKGTGFTGVKQLLDANKGGNMGANIAGRLGSSIDKTNESIRQERDEFGNILQSSTAGRPEGAIALVNKANSGQDITDQDVTDFTNAGNYTGPSGLSGNSRQAVNTASQLGKASTGQLLSRQVNNKAYNPGLRRFDETLLNRDPAMDQIRSQQQALKGMTNQYDKAGQTATAVAQTKAAELKNAQDSITSKLKGDYDKINTDIDKQYTDRMAFLKPKVEGIRTRLGTGALTQQDFDDLVAAGFDPESNFTGEEFNKMLDDSVDETTKEQLMTQEQRSKAKALAKLKKEGVLGFNDKSEDFGKPLANLSVSKDYSTKKAERDKIMSTKEYTEFNNQANVLEKTLADLDNEEAINRANGGDYRNPHFLDIQRRRREAEAQLGGINAERSKIESARAAAVKNGVIQDTSPYNPKIDSLLKDVAAIDAEAASVKANGGGPGNPHWDSLVQRRQVLEGQINKVVSEKDKAEAARKQNIKDNNLSDSGPGSYKNLMSLLAAGKKGKPGGKNTDIKPIDPNTGLPVKIYTKAGAK